MPKWNVAKPKSGDQPPDDKPRDRTSELLDRADRASGESRDRGDAARPSRDRDLREQELRKQLIAESDAHQEALRRELEAVERLRLSERELELKQVALAQADRTLAAERARAATALGELEQTLRDESKRLQDAAQQALRDR